MPKKSEERIERETKRKQVFAKRLRLAKQYRNMSHADIVKRSEELGKPMSESTVSQSLNGRIYPTVNKLNLWASIFHVSIYWLMGYGTDEQVMNTQTEEEQLKDLEKLSRWFMRLNPVRQRMILDITKELAQVPENDVYLFELADKLDKKMLNK